MLPDPKSSNSGSSFKEVFPKDLDITPYKWPDRKKADTKVYTGAVDESLIASENERYFANQDIEDDFLVLNDILFTGVPLTAIGTESIHDTVVSETLRNRSSMVISKGNRTFRLSISLVFGPGQPQQKLHRLMSQLTRNPITFIYNNAIKQRLNVPLSETTIFMLENGNIRNSSKNTGNIVLDLHFTYFNYKPFLSSFSYNSKLNGYSVDRTVDAPKDNTKEIGDLRGYGATSFLIQKEAEQFLDRLNGKVNTDIAGKYNTPVKFPSQSDAWMYYADFLQDLTQDINDYTSDCIGFKVKKYALINPTDKRARVSKASIEDVFKGGVEYPPIQEHYRVDSIYRETAGQRKTKAFVKASIASSFAQSGKKSSKKFLSEDKVEKAKQNYKTFVPSMMETVYIVEKGNVDNSSFRKIAYADKRGGKSHAGLDINSKHGAPCYTPADGVVVGVQAFEGSGFNFQIQHTEEYGSVTTWWNHMKKIIVTAGQKVKRGDLVGYVGNSQHKDGTGVTSAHIHFEVFWPGVSTVEKPVYPPGRNPDVFYLRMNPKDWLKDINAEFYQAHESYGKKRTKPNNMSGYDAKANNPSTDMKSRFPLTNTVFEKDNLDKQEAELEKVGKVSSDKNKAKDLPDIDVRMRWIAEIENKYGYKYYTSDPELKNVFYKEYETQVASDPDLYRSGKALPNIVCSSISIGFGHRVAPMHLIGHDYYTYQFLGVGNKTGTIVFTYAGRAGRESAKKIKDIIDIAHNNSRLYHHIPECGVIEFLSEIPESNEKNTILRLLDARKATITKVNEYTLPEGSDKHQLVIEFILQEFDPEKEILQRRKPTEDVGERLTIFKKVASYLTTKGKDRITNNPKSIIPHPKIANVNAKGEGKYEIKDTSIPLWFFETVVYLSEKLAEFNSRMPPIQWPMANDATNTFKDLYSLYNCDKLLWGDVENIKRPTFYEIKDEDYLRIKKGSRVKRNPYTGQAFHDPKKTYAQEYSERLAINIRDHKKFPETMALHMELLGEFEEIVGEVAKRIEANRSDIPGFKKMFPDITVDIYDTIQAEFNSCYPDLDLPPVPGLEAIALPPDFYIYRDNDEATNGLMVDRKKAQKLLEEHMSNEMASIRHYVQNSALANNYMSVNMSRIIQERRDVQELFDADLTFLDDLYYSGGKVWDPIYFEYDNPKYNTDSGKKYKAKIEKKKDSKEGDFVNITESFLDDVLKTSPYIITGRKWADGEPSSKELIERYYGQAWDKLAFGPNPAYRKVDQKLKGFAVIDFADLDSQKNTLELLKEQAKKQKKVIRYEDKNLYVHPDGKITYGISPEEQKSAWEEIKDFFVSSTATDKEIEDRIKKVKAMHSGDSEEPEKDTKWTTEDLAQTIKTINEDNENKDIESMTIEQRLAGTSLASAFGSRENDLSLKRVFPTFKIFFIEDDSEVDGVFKNVVTYGFDDFYSYNSIQDIKIHESQKNPGTIAVITITNEGNKLFNKRFGESESLNEEELVKFGIGAERQGIFSDTDQENPFEKLIMKEGVKVQIRLGYSGHPDELKTRFLGQIVEVAPIENGRLVQIVCQSYGAELEAAELGPIDTGEVFDSSQAALSAAMLVPFIVNFGRRSKANIFNPAEIRTGVTGQNDLASFGFGDFFKTIGWSILPGGLFLRSILNQKGSAKEWENYIYQNNFLNDPRDDNIYAPPATYYVDTFLGFIGVDDDDPSGCEYRPLSQTPWEIFKEHELRHPGYISYPVPYGHSPRMTMFFGPSYQNYWCRPPTELEVKLSTKAYNEIIQMKGLTYDQLDKAGYIKKIAKISGENYKLASAIMQDFVRSTAPTNSAREIGKMFGRYIPFRNYHYATSENHILQNNIRTSIDGTFNDVEVLYSPGTGTNQDVDNVSSKEDFNDLKEDAAMVSVKLDENISENNIRTYREEFLSCTTEGMAKRYAQGLFVLGLKEMYKGELVLVGNENIKPYDIIRIQDGVNDMHGPVEVKSVTHIFSRDTGYASIVEPGLCVAVNDMYSASTLDLMAAAYHHAYGFTGSPLLFAASRNPIQFAGMYGAVTFMQFTQTGMPVVINPLTFKGKPFISVTLGTNSGSIFLKMHGQWSQWTEDGWAGWRKFDLSEEISDFFNNSYASFVSPIQEAQIAQ